MKMGISRYGNILLSLIKVLPLQVHSSLSTLFALLESNNASFVIDCNVLPVAVITAANSQPSAVLC